jgi:Na+-transporting methylmalonyl-CoA/oxaloacetate decarboxylase beta subunit
MSTNQGTRREYKLSGKRAPRNKQEHASKVSKSAQIKRQEKVKRKQERLQRKKPRRRIFPIWLRIIVVLLFSALALVAGLMVGYGIIGDGVPTDALKIETWQHIVDIVKKTE